jgi:hypothetical protein
MGVAVGGVVVTVGVRDGRSVRVNVGVIVGVIGVSEGVSVRVGRGVRLGIGVSVIDVTVADGAIVTVKVGVRLGSGVCVIVGACAPRVPGAIVTSLISTGADGVGVGLLHALSKNTTKKTTSR